VQAGGATFPAPIYERWVAEYQKIHPEIKIDYQAIGSGGGIKGITDKTFDFAGSDAPLSKKEIEKLGGDDKIIEIPSVAGAVVMAYNLAGFNGDLKLDGPVIADIYLGKIKTWNDPKIVALNPDAKLPALAITPAHRTDGSGTTFIFTNYVCTQSGDFKDKIGSGKQVEWPSGSGQGGAQNAGVTAIVKQTNGAMGYIELAYALENAIPFALVKNKDGKFVKASPESVTAAGEGAVKAMEKELAVPLWDQAGEATYPISGFTYLILYRDLGYLKDQTKAKAIVAFLNWATHDGEKMASELKYAPLSDGVQKKVAQAISAASFNGAPLGGPAAK
jgi:phosphate transport system substrate-binding protein